jgi:predicted HTH transcriptional regulator
MDNIKDTKNNSGKVSIEKESLEAEKKDTGEMIETIEIKKTDYFFNDFKKTEVGREDNKERQSGRRQEILKALTGQPISIKEISQKVLGCSEKTIQRELNNLLDEKIIRREGEKRWSKYCL